MTSADTSFAARLRSLLAAAGWTQAQLAAALGVASVTVRRWLMASTAGEHRRAASLDVRRAIATALARPLRRTAASVLSELLGE